MSIYIESVDSFNINEVKNLKIANACIDSFFFLFKLFRSIFVYL